MTSEAAYQELISHLQRVHSLGSIGELLGWDEQVNLPPDSADQRAEQQAVLAEVLHAAASDRRIGELLSELERSVDSRSSSHVDRAAVLRQARKDFDRATKLPAEFVREKAEQSSRGYHAWAKRCWKRISNWRSGRRRTSDGAIVLMIT
jgi:carboxypeptidase Taq